MNPRALEEESPQVLVMERCQMTRPLLFFGAFYPSGGSRGPDFLSCRGRGAVQQLEAAGSGLPRPLPPATLPLPILSRLPCRLLHT